MVKTFLHLILPSDGRECKLGFSCIGEESSLWCDSCILRLRHRKRTTRPQMQSPAAIGTKARPIFVSSDIAWACSEVGVGESAERVRSDVGEWRPASKVFVV